MEKYLKFDDQVTVLTKHKELQQYLQFRKENDVWVQPYIKETTVVGIEDHPLFLSQYFLSNGIELNDESNDFPNLLRRMWLLRYLHSQVQRLMSISL